MATVLYLAGTLALLAGLVAIGFGSPASALDFGNTLIEAGTAGAVGGLITIAIAAAVGRLQRIAELLASPLPHDYAEPAGRPSSSPPPPPRIEPKPVAIETKPAPFEPRGPSTPPEFPAFEPEPPKQEERAEDRAIEPVHAAAAVEEDPPPDVYQAAPPVELEPEPQPAPEPSRPSEPPRLAAEPELPPRSFFDSVWPEEKTLSPAAALEAEPEPPAPEPQAPPAAEPEKPRAVAILKSGVVDGMGYTLYVDGSIEAELPDGTVRFASITELRAHLENKAD